MAFVHRFSNAGPPAHATDRDRRAGDLRQGIRLCVCNAGGFSLIELLVAMALFTVLLGAVLSALEFATKVSNNETERNVALSEVTTGVAGMMADLRRAYYVNSPTLEEASSTTTSKFMDLLVRVPGVGNRRVFYECAAAEPKGYDECIRYQSKRMSGFSAGVAPTEEVESKKVVVPRVLNETSTDIGDPVFKNISDPSKAGTQPTLVEVYVHTPGKGGLASSNYTHQVVVQNYAYLRQLDYGT